VAVEKKGGHYWGGSNSRKGLGDVSGQGGIRGFEKQDVQTKISGVRTTDRV